MREILTPSHKPGVDGFKFVFAVPRMAEIDSIPLLL